jgi:hypothetical protein
METACARQNDQARSDHVKRDPTTFCRRNRQDKYFTFARCKIVYVTGNAGRVQANTVTCAFRLIRYRDAKTYRLAGKDGIGPGKSQLQTDEVALALVH